ncbi:hypothetical protein C1J03_11210 [Sulfitobacter sp. SK012]|uniref:DUF2059 domain-containing protein n=1 Tax=Sulfitobacter sp. SK012 TaxID=1389005 RepID=UPI000E0C4794|nr:DUF2059 domain-containing protein [Sulfitobacter sp. SK012]AXI46535.1 hypothetical protein C1J03_11210 [Sulfitobacter sp. SK012]
MRPLILSLALWLGASPLWADARHTVLMDVLQIAQLTQILHEEGLEYAEDLNADMLMGTGGAGWQIQAEAIYDPYRLSEGIRKGLEGHVNSDHLEESITFFASDLGQKIIGLENSARVAMADGEVEAAARDRFAALEDTDDARLALLTRMTQTGDLVTRNVTSALNSNYQFLRGMVDGDAYDMTDDEILTEVGADREEITADTESWLGAFLLLAYSPLSDAELEAYVAFSETDAGLALNAGFFAGFDPLYEDIAYALGRAVALNMTAQEL